MTPTEKRTWAKKLKPFWEAREKHFKIFRIAEEAIEFDMRACLKEDLEFFYVDGECVGIGHSDFKRRHSKNKDYFPLIHDRELE